MDALVPHGLNGPHRSLPNRRTLVKGAAWAAPTLLVATTAPAVAASQSRCHPVGTLFDARAGARMLSGSLGNRNLDDLDELVALAGVHAQATDPATGTDSVERVIKNDPLQVDLLSAISLDLGGTAVALSQILTILTDQGVGTVQQFARADQSAEATDSEEIGGAGLVGEDGTLALNMNDPEPPALGTLDLRSLLEQVTGSDAAAALVTAVAQLELQIGAVGGRAFFDSLCEIPEIEEIEEIDRDYNLAYLRLLIESDVVGDVLGALSSLTIGTDAVLGVLRNVPIIGPLIATLGNSVVSANVTVDVEQLTGSFPNDPNAALSMNLGEGTVLVDVASLLGGAYQGGVSPWLNTQAPNTRLFVDTGIPGDPVSDFVDDVLQSLLDRIEDLVSVRITVGGGVRQRYTWSPDRRKPR